MEVMVGHPDAHGRILLSEELPASDGVAVFVPDPFAQSELYDAKQQGRHPKPNDAVPIATAIDEDEMDGLAQGQEQGHRPEIEGETFISADEMVGFRPQEL